MQSVRFSTSIFAHSKMKPSREEEAKKNQITMYIYFAIDVEARPAANEWCSSVYEMSLAAWPPEASQELFLYLAAFTKRKTKSGSFVT